MQGLNNDLIQKIQKVQNSCIRYSHGLRKYDHISHIRKSNKTLCMQDRSLLHGLSLMFKITRNIAPIYLCNRITFRNALHHYNTRRRNDIVTPFARSRARTMSFFIHVAKKYNELSRCIDLTHISVNTFKKKCKKYLLDKEV